MEVFVVFDFVFVVIAVVVVVVVVRYLTRPIHVSNKYI